MKNRLASQHADAAADPDQDFRPILQSLVKARPSIVGVFSDFCRIVACCLAMQTREEEYLQAIQGYSTGELNQLAKAIGFLINEMEAKPFEDVLGMYYTESIASADQSARGEFFTPRSISTMMSRMSMDVEKIKAEGKPVTISDPCCGSGATILACAETLKPRQDLMRVTLQDINPTACDMAYINTTLWGIPAEIILGNTLKVECLARWTNVHWHLVGEEQRRRSLKMLDMIRDLPKPSASPPNANAPPTPPPPSGSDIQLDLF